LLNVLYSLMHILFYKFSSESYTCLLSCYGLLMYIHSYFISFNMVMNIIAQIHVCMPCEAP
jgi:hypothetical protein